MMVGKFEIWLANLEPGFGTETGKTRPVLIVQTDLLNKVHPSTLVCPITTNIKPESKILRVHLGKESSNLKEDCDVMIDQLRAIDNRRLLKKIGQAPKELGEQLKTSLRIVMDLD